MVWNDVFRLFFLESFSGDEAYDRLQWTTMDVSHDFNEEQWREPASLDYDGAGGVAAADDGSSVMWLAASDGVWLATLPAYAEVNADDDVVYASVRCGPDGSEVELELNNADGGYTGYSSTALQRGARLQLTPGYATSAGNEVPLAYSYWVESVELITGARPRLKVRARDGWALLQTWRARRQFVWAAGDKTISQLLLFIVARAGLEATAGGSTSAALTGLQPAFTIHAGESGLTAVRRLLAKVEDLAYWDGATLTTEYTADDDSSTYDFGTTHDVVEAVYRDLGPSVNRARVVGLDVYGDESDYAAAFEVERIAQVIDLSLTDGEDARKLAIATLRKAAIEAREDRVTLFGVHCGLELFDVITLTDPAAGLEAQPRRVLGYEWRYEPRRRRYEMALTLGNV